MEPPLKKYPESVIDGIGKGCLLDYRVRLAIQLLQSPMFEGAGLTERSGDIAVTALNVATELLALAESRGLVEPFPAGTGLNDEEERQAKRTGAFQVAQQMGAQEYAQRAQAGKVVPVAPGIMPGGGRPN